MDFGGRSHIKRVGELLGRSSMVQYVYSNIQRRPAYPFVKVDFMGTTGILLNYRTMPLYLPEDIYLTFLQFDPHSYNSAINTIYSAKTEGR